MNIPHFAFYPHDWLSDTRVQQLTHEERGVYFDILCHMWTFAGERGEFGLPDNDLFFQRLLRVRPAKWKKLRGVLIDGLAPVLHIEDGKIVNRRLFKEYQKAKAKSEQASEAARRKVEKGKEGDTARERDPKREGMPSPDATEKNGDESSKSPLLKESESADAHADGVRETCHTDLDLDTDTDLKTDIPAVSQSVDESDFQVALDVYRELVGLIGPTQHDKLRFWREEKGMPGEVIAEAIAEAAETKRAMGESTPFSYIEGIIRNWYNDKVFTLDEARRKRAPPGQRGQDPGGIERARRQFADVYD